MLDIYIVLISKSSNLHYINRYINFVNSCKSVNETLNENTYTELHHICPKAADLFPQYNDLKQYPENGIHLTFRQHLIAHVLLWKIFGGSQLVALDCMLDKFNSNNNNYSLFRRKVPTSIKIRYLEKVKLESYQYRGEQRKGFGTYKDPNNNKYFLHRDDSLIEELNLVGNNNGHCHTEESKQTMSSTKRPNKIVKLYFLDCKVSIKLFSSEYSDYIAQGWNSKRTTDDLSYIRLQANIKNSTKMSGTGNYMYPDTKEFFDRLPKDDPKIVELGLVPLMTDNHRKQWDDRAKKGREALRGANIYNNGTTEARFREDPGGDWILGRIPRSENYKQNFLDSIRAKNTGSFYWNDGIICKKLPKDQHPGEDWVRGMLPRRSKNVSAK